MLGSRANPPPTKVETPERPLEAYPLQQPVITPAKPHSQSKYPFFPPVPTSTSCIFNSFFKIFKLFLPHIHTLVQTSSILSIFIYINRSLVSCCTCCLHNNRIIF
ncbi:hypothetical protein BDR22DRAFT_431039 [Usnea florida]